MFEGHEILMDTQFTNPRGNNVARQVFVKLAGGGSVRVLLSVDGYKDQSYVMVEFWTRDGWTKVVAFKAFEIPLPLMFAMSDSGRPAAKRELETAMKTAFKLALEVMAA